MPLTLNQSETGSEHLRLAYTGATNHNEVVANREATPRPMMQIAWTASETKPREVIGSLSRFVMGYQKRVESCSVCGWSGVGRV